MMKLLSLLIAVAMAAGAPLPLWAESAGEGSPSLGEEGTVLVSYTSSSGEYCTEVYAYSDPIIITGVPSNPGGEYTIHMSSAVITMSYKIYIENNRIVSVYGGQYTAGTGVSVTGTSLTRNSDVQATYLINCIYNQTYMTKWLRANISTGYLSVTHN